MVPWRMVDGRPVQAQPAHTCHPAVVVATALRRCSAPPASVWVTAHSGGTPRAACLHARAEERLGPREPYSLRETPAGQSMRLRLCACGPARRAKRAACLAASRSGARLGGGFQWCGVGDRGARAVGGKGRLLCLYSARRVRYTCTVEAMQAKHEPTLPTAPTRIACARARAQTTRRTCSACTSTSSRPCDAEDAKKGGLVSSSSDRDA